jgi:hypothetical protein
MQLFFRFFVFIIIFSSKLMNSSKFFSLILNVCDLFLNLLIFDALQKLKVENKSCYFRLFNCTTSLSLMHQIFLSFSSLLIFSFFLSLILTSSLCLRRWASVKSGPKENWLKFVWISQSFRCLQKFVSCFSIFSTITSGFGLFVSLAFSLKAPSTVFSTPRTWQICSISLMSSSFFSVMLFFSDSFNPKIITFFSFLFLCLFSSETTLSNFRWPSYFLLLNSIAHVFSPFATAAAPPVLFWSSVILASCSLFVFSNFSILIVKRAIASNAAVNSGHGFV